jgi:hypothetical protein
MSYVGYVWLLRYEVVIYRIYYVFFELTVRPC